MEEKHYWLAGVICVTGYFVGLLGNDVYDKYRTRKNKKRIMELDFEDAKQKRDLTILLSMIQKGVNKEEA